MNDVWSTLTETVNPVFSRPRISPQGQDGTAFFGYYDAERHLSFIWDGHLDQNVNVSHGGYGEPVLWTFDLQQTFCARRNETLVRNNLPEDWDALPLVLGSRFAEATQHFQEICDYWITTMERDFALVD